MVEHLCDIRVKLILNFYIFKEKALLYWPCSVCITEATDNTDCNIDSEVEFNTSVHGLLKIKVLRGGFC